MGNITINDASLALLAAGQVAVDDVIPIWDTSAAAMKRANRSVAVGANISGDGAIATNGFSVAIPAGGTVAIREVANAFAGLVTLPAVLTGSTGAVLDDNVYSFTPSSNVGLILIWNLMAAASVANRSAIIAYRAVATPYCVLLAQPSTVVEVATTALTGTTGTDGKITIAAAADGKLYFENRGNSTGNWGYLILGTA